MREYTFMVKPASSLCNLRCLYCFYDEVSSNRDAKSYGFMTKITTKKVLDNICAFVTPNNTINFVFQGGEPTLVGIEFFSDFINLAKQTLKNRIICYSIQTNGMLIDDSWCKLFKDNDFLVGISIDSFESNHNTYRMDKKERGTYLDTINVKKLFDKHNVQYNILATLTNGLAKNIEKTWEFIVNENIKYIQFTPCLQGLFSKRKLWDLNPETFCLFYKNLFTFWKKAALEGNYISVKLFDDIVNFFVKKQVTACGMHGQCNLQYIIEANGNIYPCDFYSLDKYCGGNATEMNFAEIEENMINTGFLIERSCLPEICYSCKYIKVCSGGCKRISEAVYIDKSGLYCGYRDLLDSIGQDICDTAFKLISDQ